MTKYEQVKSFINDEVFTEPRWIPQNRLMNCVMLSDRVRLISMLPMCSVGAEVGTLRGDFAKQIIEALQPDELHIFDISFEKFDRKHFEDAIEAGRVILHEGDSSSQMKTLRETGGRLDWIYIDGDHTLEGVRADIEQAKHLIKDDGVLIFNDYVNYSPLEHMQYGVIHAVNDLVIDEGFEVIAFALNAMGYHDVAVRRIQAE